MYPKMLPEVMEAIETHFCDDKDIMIDCVLYLMNATCREEDVAYLKQWLQDRNRCVDCGEELVRAEYREYHPECGPGVYEVMSEYYCPNCGGFND